MGLISSVFAQIHILMSQPHFYKIDNQVFTAVAKINRPIVPCNTFVFNFLPMLAPIGEAIKLATTIINAGSIGIFPVAIFPETAPMDEINVMAKEEAIVILVGILRTTSIIGTNKNAPPAPTIPAPIPTMNANKDASHLLNFI